MAAHEKKPASTADRREVSSVDGEKKYPVVHAILLGKGETRERRTEGHVTAAEVGGEAAIQQLLKQGAIRDPDEPIRPSEASEAKARSVVMDIALEGEAITREGEKYRVAERVLDAEALGELPLTELAAIVVATLKKTKR